jgi:hypothetical protein
MNKSSLSVEELPGGIVSLEHIYELRGIGLAQNKFPRQPDKLSQALQVLFCLSDILANPKGGITI